MKMNSIKNLAVDIRNLFQRYDACIDDMTLIFNFTSKHNGGMADYVFARELTEYCDPPVVGKINPSHFRIMGITFKVESPAHDIYEECTNLSES